MDSVAKVLRVVNHCREQVVYLDSTLRSDVLTVLYDSDGDTLWSVRYDCPQGGSIEQGSALAVGRSGEFAIAGRGDGHGTFYDFLLIKYTPGGSLSPGPAQPHVTRVLRATPNPASASLRVITDARPEPVQLTVHDAAGRLVRRLRPAFLATGVAEAVWDLRDESGVRVAPGVYFVLAVGIGTGASCRVVVAQ